MRSRRKNIWMIFLGLVNTLISYVEQALEGTIHCILDFAKPNRCTIFDLVHSLIAIMLGRLVS